MFQLTEASSLFSRCASGSRNGRIEFDLGQFPMTSNGRYELKRRLRLAFVDPGRVGRKRAGTDSQGSGG